MNIKNVKKLRTRIRSRKNPVGWNMGVWFVHERRVHTRQNQVMEAVIEHPCGTAACVAGHAAILAWQEGGKPPNNETLIVNELYNTAADFLGLTEKEAYHLFFGRWSPTYGRKPMGDISKASTVKELTRLIKVAEAKESVS